jgi:hypothetical protein
MSEAICEPLNGGHGPPPVSPTRHKDAGTHEDGDEEEAEVKPIGMKKSLEQEEQEEEEEKRKNVNSGIATQARGFCSNYNIYMLFL